MVSKEEGLAVDYEHVQRVVNDTAARRDYDAEQLFELSLDLMCVADLESGHFKRLNPAWTDRLGWRIEELTARPFIDFVHPDDRENTQAEVERLVAGDKTIMFENRWRHLDGTYRWLQWNAHRVDPKHRIYATARDVTHQKRLEREILEILDHERTRVGQELHDGLCQNLAGIAALSSRLSRSLTSESERAASASATEITQLLHDCIGEAHNLARGLGPVGPENADLDESLEMLAQNIRRQFEIACSLNCDGSIAGIDDSVKAHLYRIAQEACHNGVTHGHADRITIDLTRDNGQLVMCIRDDGIGIPETLRNPEGIGMHTMAYRATSVGGTLEIRHRNCRGTAVTCTLPMPESQGTD